MTEAELHQRAAELFLRVRALSGAERRDALHAAAGGDPRLLTEVEQLLAYDVEDTADDTEREGLFGGGEYDAPARIGPYRIVRRIGRGGSGHVFLAEQESPIRRRVAVKVVPMAAVSAELAARFEVERRALECADHPNIARVLDAGRTDDGSPYLVMDYVEGAPITEYCRERGLGVVSRVRLMLDVADAVEHVHRFGVIHRDLKPANILVAESDGRPTPRVLDFGIAKPMPGELADESPATSGLPLGTPSYMAPEQTGLGPIDTRADVYALGAVLYELIAGGPPIEGGGDPLDVLHRIRERIPAPVSRALREKEGGRGSSCERVPASMLADLDCILARSLEKSPERRYTSASAWATDLERCLRCEPIEARRPTVGYRIARFAQRNRAAVASGAVVVLAVMVGIAGLAAGLIEADRQRGEAMMQSEALREINRFLTEDLLSAASPEEMGHEVSALDLLERASRRVDGRFPLRPDIAGSVHHTLGATYAQLGVFEEAERHLLRALELRNTTVGTDSAESLRTSIALAGLLVRRERHREAEKALVEVLERARATLGQGDPALYTALNDLGVARASLGDAAGAVEVLQEALGGRERLFGSRHRDVLTTTANLAFAYDSGGEPERSLAMLLEALEIAESLPDPPAFTVLGLHNNIGATYQDLGENEAAAPYLRRAAELAEGLLSADHPATLSIKGNLAGLEADLGEPARAAELYREVAERRAGLIGADAPQTLTAWYGYWNAVWKDDRAEESAVGFASLLPEVERVFGAGHWMVGATGVSLAVALRDCGRPGEALGYAQRAEAVLAVALGEEHNRTRSARDLVEGLSEAAGEGTEGGK